MSEIADKIYQDDTICSYEEIKAAALEAKDCVQDIREKILDEVSNDADLADLNSTSSAAIWRIWIDIFAFLSFYMQQLWRKCKCELEEAARAAQPHTLAWYCQRAYEFQFGDALQASGGAIFYDPVDESKQIIKSCSVSENACNLLFKVKKEDNTPLIHQVDGSPQQRMPRGFFQGVRKGKVVFHVRLFVSIVSAILYVVFSSVILN